MSRQGGRVPATGLSSGSLSPYPEGASGSRRGGARVSTGGNALEPNFPSASRPNASARINPMDITGGSSSMPNNASREVSRAAGNSRSQHSSSSQTGQPNGYDRGGGYPTSSSNSTYTSRTAAGQPVGATSIRTRKTPQEERGSDYGLGGPGGMSRNNRGGGMSTPFDVVVTQNDPGISHLMPEVCDSPTHDEARPPPAGMRGAMSWGVGPNAYEHDGRPGTRGGSLNTDMEGRPTTRNQQRPPSRMISSSQTHLPLSSLPQAGGALTQSTDTAAMTLSRARANQASVAAAAAAQALQGIDANSTLRRSQGLIGAPISSYVGPGRPASSAMPTNPNLAAHQMMRPSTQSPIKWPHQGMPAQPIGGAVAASFGFGSSGRSLPAGTGGGAGAAPFASKGGGRGAGNAYPGGTGARRAQLGGRKGARAEDDNTDVDRFLDGFEDDEEDDDSISQADSAHDLNDFLSSLDQGDMRSVLRKARVGSDHASSGGSSPSSVPLRASVSGKGERAVSRGGKLVATPGAKGRLSVASKVPVVQKQKAKPLENPDDLYSSDASSSQRDSSSSVAALAAISVLQSPKSGSNTAPTAAASASAPAPHPPRQQTPQERHPAADSSSASSAEAPQILGPHKAGPKAMKIIMTIIDRLVTHAARQGSVNMVIRQEEERVLAENAGICPPEELLPEVGWQDNVRASTQFSSMGNDFSSILRSTHMDSSPKLARVPPDSATAMHMISHLLSTDDFRHINNLPAAPAGGPPAGKNVPAPSLGLPVVGSHRTATASSENQQQHRPQGSNNGSAAFESHAFAGGFGVGMTPAMGRFVR